MNRRVTAVTLTQSIQDHLKGRIHGGTLSPGDRLPPERELAASLGVARVSLREAIRQLAAEGYVEVRRGPHGGTFITSLREPFEQWRVQVRERVDEMDDMIDFRVAVESHVAALAAVRRAADDLSAMSDAIERLAQATALGAFRLADSQFHDAVARASRSTRLEAAVHQARGEFFSPAPMFDHTLVLEDNRREHQAVYEAIKDGDDQRAAAAMRAHIGHTREQLHLWAFEGDSTSR
ncbi:FadR/GntR family transcriptional regulator [Streptomyces sp. NPDC088350]|uniref:FadR/GntR family transcriptional regulator n=1 Tax=Streptomyces sp. NPDC088350 TaxID=3365854 RepID=UPI0038010E84